MSDCLELEIKISSQSKPTLDIFQTLNTDCLTPSNFKSPTFKLPTIQIEKNGKNKVLSHNFFGKKI